MKIAVSACLLGELCRYDGSSQPCGFVQALTESHELIPLCPEMAGGLSVPRNPCEIVTSERVLRVHDAENNDFTVAYMSGAQAALTQLSEQGCKLAILKSKSPSCGSRFIYDGAFSGTLVPGVGVTARLLREAGIRVVDEAQLQDILATASARHPGVHPAIFAETAAQCPVLETERLVLRALTTADALDTFAYCSDPDVGADAGWPMHRSIEDSQVFVNEIAAAPHTFGIFEKAENPLGKGGRNTKDSLSESEGSPLPKSGPCIGSVGLMPDPHRKNPDCLMLGYALAKSAWGKGYMTEAAQEVLRYGFGDLGLSMISVTHYAFNNRSCRVIEKCGFHREGVLRSVEPGVDGMMEDMVFYSLRSEESCI